MRLIDGDALVKVLEREKLSWTTLKDQTLWDALCNYARNAPTITPAPAEGDAISRKDILSRLGLTRSIYRSDQVEFREYNDAIRAVLACPALPAPTDVVTVEDVVEGVEFMDEHGSTYQVAGAEEFMYVYGTRPTDSSGGGIERDPSDRLCLPRMLVAAMLNAAETITWPDGHPRAKKPGPALEDLVIEYTNLPDMDSCRGLELVTLMAQAAERAKREK